ncbi:S26 family signal peptidase [Novosphingobium sp.]|uniref:S26 family signal peptidase n=1 Tax=Novosphingobium sp. TaxID=1874826 RepID=UPI0038BE0A6B
MFRHACKAAKAVWPEIRLLPLRAAVALGSSGLGQPLRPAQLWKAYAIVLPIGLVAAWALPQVTWVMSPSIDAVAVRSSPGPIHRGDYVMFLLSNPLAGPTPVNVTKQALCLPGEHIAMVERFAFASGIKNAWYYCDGRLLNVSKPLGRHGQQLDHWHPAQATIPAGFVFVGSHHPGGFDSRYYGPVAIERLTRMAKIL